MKLLLYMSVLTGLLFPQDLHLKQGMEAPRFSLEDQNGIIHSLSEFKGKSPVVVYFYPKAGSSGCTKQACGIRDDYTEFKKLSVPVFGISTDTKEEIIKFVKDYNLNFPLLSDSSKEVSKAYGVLKPAGTDARYTFIIDKEGKIYDIIEVKDIASHSREVLKKLKKII